MEMYPQPNILTQSIPYLLLCRFHHDLFNSLYNGCAKLNVVLDLGILCAVEPSREGVELPLPWLLFQ